MAARPRTLGASLVPVVVGTAVAAREGAVRPGVLGACLLAALLLQVTANLVNDALDFLHGVDHGRRLGPERVTQQGLLPPARVLRAAMLCLALALGAGATLVRVGGAPILAIGVLAALGAVGYTAGPFPLATHALGEAAAFLFFGVIAVGGTAYLQTGHLSVLAVLASLPVGCLVSSLMLVNNLRDIPSDRGAGKRTLAVRLGDRRTRALHLALLSLAYLGALLLWLREPGRVTLLLPCLSLPLAVPLAREVLRARDGPSFHRALAGTARLHAVFGALLAGGLAG